MLLVTCPLFDRAMRLGQLGEAFAEQAKINGLVFEIKSAANYLGFNTNSRIRYPMGDIVVRVWTHNIWKALERREWEYNCLSFVASKVNKGDVILDIGAFYGQYSILFSKLVGDIGVVYAFEPSPRTLAILRNNTGQNGLDNITTIGLCLSNIVGSMTLRTFGHSSDRNTIIKESIDLPFKEITVSATTVDDFCKENSVQPNGIKVDVEGAEGLVIEGAENVLRKCSPWVLLEFHGMLMSEEARENNWRKISETAKKIILLGGGRGEECRVGEEIGSPPSMDFLRNRLHLFIQY